MSQAQMILEELQKALAGARRELEDAASWEKSYHHGRIEALEAAIAIASLHI